MFASIKSLDPELYVVIDKFGEVRFSKSKHGAFMIAGGVPRMVPLTVGGLLKMLGPQLVEVKDKLGNKFRIHLYGLDWVIEDSKGKLTKIPSKELDMKKTGLVETKAGFVFHLATTSGNSQFSFNVTKKDGDKIIAKWLKG